MGSGGLRSLEDLIRPMGRHISTAVESHFIAIFISVKIPEVIRDSQPMIPDKQTVAQEWSIDEYHHMQQLGFHHLINKPLKSHLAAVSCCRAQEEKSNRASCSSLPRDQLPSVSYNCSNHSIRIPEEFPACHYKNFKNWYPGLLSALLPPHSFFFQPEGRDCLYH